jgi:hypothetical protein
MEVRLDVEGVPSSAQGEVGRGEVHEAEDIFI